MSFGYDTRSAQLAQPTTRSKADDDTAQGHALPTSTSNMVLDRADGTWDKKVAAATAAKATATQSASSSGKNVLEYLASQLSVAKESLGPLKDALAQHQAGDAGAEPALDEIARTIGHIKDTAISATAMINATYRDDRNKLVSSAKKAIAQWQDKCDFLVECASSCDAESKKGGATGAFVSADVQAIDGQLKDYGLLLLHRDLTTTSDDLASPVETSEASTLRSYIATAQDALTSVKAGNDGDVVKLEAVTPFLGRLQAVDHSSRREHGAHEAQLAELCDGLRSESAAQRSIHNTRLANRLDAVLGQIKTLVPEKSR